jgi:hypothetical protein
MMPCTIYELAQIVQAHGPLPDRLDPRKWEGGDSEWWGEIERWMKDE